MASRKQNFQPVGYTAGALALKYDQQVRPQEYRDDNKRKKFNNTRADKDVRYEVFAKRKVLTVDEKIEYAVNLTKMALSRATNPVVSCSFGIDSILTLYVTKKALAEICRPLSSIKVVWNDTVNEFPTVRKYAKTMTESLELDLLVTKPKKPLKKIIEDNGGIDSSYFTARKGERTQGQPLSEKCCGTLKHEPMNRAIKENGFDLIINGLRADESSQRLRAALRDGEYFYSSGTWKSYMLRPILWFSDEEVWEYVFKEEIPYNELYDQNVIKEYPDNHLFKVLELVDELKEVMPEEDVEKFVGGELQMVSKKASFVLERHGYKLFTPRTGCMQCPIPVKYGYLQFMRLAYPKVYTSMIYNLGYGKALLDMVPEDVKQEVEFLTGVKIDEENAHEHLKEILESKPCVFDKF